AWNTRSARILKPLPVTKGKLCTWVLVGSAGFEPATFAVSGRRPNQASPTRQRRLRRRALVAATHDSVSSFSCGLAPATLSSVAIQLIRVPRKARCFMQKKIQHSALAISLLALVLAAVSLPAHAQQVNTRTDKSATHPATRGL